LIKEELKEQGLVREELDGRKLIYEKVKEQDLMMSGKKQDQVPGRTRDMAIK